MNQQDDISTASDPDIEELTAYLDGELDADARTAVERRLADDEAFRLRMQGMEDAWALLDSLPRTEVDAEFTQTTVEMVALAAKDEVDELEKTGRRNKWLGWIGIAGGVALAAWLGFYAVDQYTSAENDQLVRDLPVIEKVDLYRHIDDIEFLRELQAEGLFEDSVSAETMEPIAQPDDAANGGDDDAI